MRWGGGGVDSDRKVVNERENAKSLQSDLYYEHMVRLPLRSMETVFPLQSIVRKLL